MTKSELIAFEDKVKVAFLSGLIRAPVHLSGGNEDQLIEVFKQVQPEDWVFSSWRSHYHALLKGIPEQWVFDEILAGRSMYLMMAEHRFMAGSIVAGMLPIACGVALGIKRSGGSEQVLVCVGDMAERTGLFHEFSQYCRGHGLPVRIVVEDNGLSTNTPTKEAWGEGTGQWKHYYQYQRSEPHVGAGKHVNFG